MCVCGPMDPRLYPAPPCPLPGLNRMLDCDPPFCREPSQLATYTCFWREEVLCPDDALAAAGVAYHLADTLLPELCRLAAEGGSVHPDAAALAALLEPFCQALAGARDAAMVHRLRDGLFQPLLREVVEPGEGKPLRCLDAPALAARLFELGARGRGRRRRAMAAAAGALHRVPSFNHCIIVPGANYPQRMLGPASAGPPCTPRLKVSAQ